MGDTQLAAPAGPGPLGPAPGSPFMRSRMKLSLSGVWKAYDMQTMKGQSCEGGAVSRGCAWSLSQAAQGTHRHPGSPQC